MVQTDLSNWMASLSPQLKSLSITSLAIPGSHDSMTYTIRKDSPVAPDAEKIVQELIKFCGILIRPIVYSWCVTQTCNILEQLDLGIRYFDLRLATKEGSDGFYVVHGLYGSKVNEIFQDIRDFLDSHPKEVIILDMQHFYWFTQADHQNFISLLERMFPRMLCPLPINVSEVTLSWMIQNQYRVIVIYRHQSADSVSFLWKSELWPTPWPQTMSTDELLKFLDSKLHQRPKNAGFVSQCVLTPTNWTVIKSPFSSIKSKCAIPACKAFMPWLEQKQQGSVNVVIADYVQIDSFPSAVVALNFK